jgi:hypothetical protein
LDDVQVLPTEDSIKRPAHSKCQEGEWSRDNRLGLEQTYRKHPQCADEEAPSAGTNGRYQPEQ